MFITEIHESPGFYTPREVSWNVLEQRELIDYCNAFVPFRNFIRIF
jgi:hypothetical protein